MSDPQLEQLVTQIANSAKYRDLHPDIVARVGAQELARRANLREAVKTTKRKLHQIGGAYFRQRTFYERWLGEMAAVHDDPAALRETCQRIMAAHASTNERLPELGAFYQQLLGDLPPIRRILDLACGMNPLAIPWMGLAPDCCYAGIDMYGDLMSFLATATPMLNVTPEMWSGDISRCRLDEPADVALILKTLPVLDQVDPEASLRLLQRVPAPVVIVTFPSRSLGRRDKGMAQNYQRRFDELAEGQSWQFERFDFESELAFRINKG